MAIQTGKVKFFNQEKRFGFITPDDGSKDVFVHLNSVNNNAMLYENDAVSFSVQQSPKGLSAINVDKL